MAAVVVAALVAAPPVVLAETGKRPPKLERITIDGLVPYHRAEKPITDGEGRIRAIVDLMDEATERQLDAARSLIERFDPKRDRHNPQALLAIEAFERRHGIQPKFRENERGERERSNVTSWVGASVTAYLTAGQIEAIRRDPDVRLVTEDAPSVYSSHATWTDTTAGGETSSWGWHAVNGRSVVAGSQRAVYVMDSGVGHHVDLGSVWRRTFGFDAHYGYGVGCYSHATHVAGIIGASVSNGTGTRGVYAGVGIVSMTGGGAIIPSACMYNGTGLTVDDIGLALDAIYSENIRRSNWVPYPQIVNLSFNGGETGYAANGVAQSNQTKIARLAAPSLLWGGGWRHPGHVVVQSAGNQFINACNTTDYGYSLAYLPHAFATEADHDDGVMVVGALRANGRTVGGSGGAFSPTVPTGLTGTESGSNFGSCVDLWAPGDSIAGLWGSYGGYTSGTTVYANVAWLSGTSMAAPHVAAAAAYFADAYGLTSPAAIEGAVRAAATPVYWWAGLGWWPSTDQSGVAVRMVRLP